MLDLWPSQVRAVDGLRANFRDGVRRQVLSMPTGSGKTITSIYMFAEAAKKGSHCVFVADRKALVFQASARFSEHSIPHGIYMSDYTRGLDENLIIASAQTMRARNHMSSRPVDLVVIDECHEIQKWVVEYCQTNNIRTIGLTATAMIEGLDKHYDSVVSVVTTEELTRDGYLAPLRVVAPVDESTEVDTKGLRLHGGEWSRRDVGERGRRVTGNVLRDWQGRTEEYFGGPVKTIVFCASIADGIETCDAFVAAGFDFGVVHNKQSDEENANVIRAYHEGRLIGIVNVNMLARGFDCPDTLCVVDKAPVAKALHVVIQRIGRVLRIAPGKEYGLYLDPAGNCAGFYEDLILFFANGVEDLTKTELKDAKRKAKEKQRADIKCAECGYLFIVPASVCPVCGHLMEKKSAGRPKTREVDGDMEEIINLDGSMGKFDGDWWPELCCLALKICKGDHDRARRFALARYKAIFKRWPPRGSEFVVIDDREPHPVVASTSYKHYQRYMIAKRKREEKQRKEVA